MKPVIVVDKVLDTASRLFFNQGYNLTGINQIVSEANVSKASLYQHFPNKSDILMAYLDRLYKRWFEELELFTAKMNEPMDKLIGLFDYRIHRQKETNFGGCAWTKISAEMPKDEVEVFSRVHKFKTDLKNHIVRLVKEVKRGKNNPLTNELLSETIFLLLEGGQVMACVDKNVNALEDAKKIIRKMFQL